MAKERAQFKEAAELCRSALESDPDNTLHYLNLGRILLMQGKKSEAMEIFNKGLRHGSDPRISADLQMLGTRRRPVIPFLNRKHLLNQSLGYILDKALRKRH
jgi:tetratricopeptide (TPR) repeat protein